MMRIVKKIAISLFVSVAFSSLAFADGRLVENPYLLTPVDACNQLTKDHNVSNNVVDPAEVLLDWACKNAGDRLHFPLPHFLGGDNWRLKSQLAAAEKKAALFEAALIAAASGNETLPQQLLAIRKENEGLKRRISDVIKALFKEIKEKKALEKKLAAIKAVLK